MAGKTTCEYHRTRATVKTVPLRYLVKCKRQFPMRMYSVHHWNAQRIKRPLSRKRHSGYVKSYRTESHIKASV